MTSILDRLELVLSNLRISLISFQLGNGTLLSAFSEFYEFRHYNSRIGNLNLLTLIRPTSVSTSNTPS
jgi:hypothetical protein